MVRITRAAMTLLVAALTFAPLSTGTAQGNLTQGDTALVLRLLSAEERRDSMDPGFVVAARNRDSRIRGIALRALQRIRDPKYSTRDSLPGMAPTSWPEPAWRLRFRALMAQRTDCGALRAAFADSAWPVRLRAMDLATNACATDNAMVADLVAWVDGLRASTNRRVAGDVSWHPAAHAIVALARLRPEEARSRLSPLARHEQWQVRLYAARAAGLAADTARLRAMALDRDNNVREEAIEGLTRLVGHAEDATYAMALRSSSGAQAVRAAAIALKGTPVAAYRLMANNVFDAWVAHGNASERDARVALLEAAGRPVTDDKPPTARAELPLEVVRLALGVDIRLRVTMSPATGGGSFVVRLRGDVAPIMAARILELARAKYYDGLSWQRVEHDFVIQGGSPGANEYVGWSRYLVDELGSVPHRRGTVGMSTRGHDTGDAQWFVNLRDNLRLNTDYTVFAEVVEGIEVVDGIFEGDVIQTVEEIKP